MSVMGQERPESTPLAGGSAADWLEAHSRWIEKSTEANFGLGRVYVVCMESRLEHTRRFLEKNGILGRVSILNAFTPDQVDMKELVDLEILSPHFSQKGGLNRFERAVCCSLSHLACWVDAQRSQAGSALFLEDDLAWADEREGVSNLIELASPHSWDLLYLSYCHATQGTCRVFTDELIELKGQLCTSAYALAPSVMESLLDSAFPIQVIIDMHMRDHAKSKGLVALGASSLLFQQDRSSVQSSFGRERLVSPPAWHPALRQKLISLGYSLLTFSGAAGYDEAIYLIDRRRQGQLTEEDRHPVIRVWDTLQHLRPTRGMRRS